MHEVRKTLGGVIVPGSPDPRSWDEKQLPQPVRVPRRVLQALPTGLIQGDCLAVLRTLPDASVHCVVTSPPYWSLRDYGVPPTVWGGCEACDHVWESAGTREGYTSKKKWQHSMTKPPKHNGRGGDVAESERARARTDGGWTQVEQGKFCARCGAWLGCLGLEPTPDLYVEHIVQVFAEVRRVLRKDGTCWLNLGDCYAKDSKWGGASGGKHAKGLHGATGIGRNKRFTGLKSKDLVGIPWRVAFALQAAGWILRSDNIWSKTNPMPESCKDRTTKSHEYVFMLTKSPRYFFDAHAIRETSSPNTHSRGRGVSPKSAPATSGIRANVSFHAAVKGRVANRNRRTVWTLPTKPYKGAHFATFPPKLVEPCILAGASEHGCCAKCGAPYRRQVAKGARRAAQQRACGGDVNGQYSGTATKDYAAAGAQAPSAVKARILAGMVDNVTVGWKRTCRHDDEPIVPCTVLDPFAGTGTTGMVAAVHKRAFVGIELGEHNITLANERMDKGWTPKAQRQPKSPPPVVGQVDLFAGQESA